MEHPLFYRLFACSIRTRRGYVVHVQDYIRPSAGDRILDIGCGLGEILEFLPAVQYLGIDMNPRYISYARKHFGGRGEFMVGKVGKDTHIGMSGFDIVLLNGILHHLSDAEALDILSFARSKLGPDGRLVSLDGCFSDNQPGFARFLLSRDRGGFVRTREGYERLARSLFPRVTSGIFHDFSRVPYSILIMECAVSGKIKDDVWMGSRR
jgi:SAM-dependent methyltransferase